MRLPYYTGVLRYRVLEAQEADKAEAITVASAAEGEGVLADLEASGWLERG